MLCRGIKLKNLRVAPKPEGNRVADRYKAIEVPDFRRSGKTKIRCGKENLPQKKGESTGNLTGTILSFICIGLTKGGKLRI